MNGIKEICVHKKRRGICLDCKLLGLGGNSLCFHLKRKSRCRLCGTYRKETIYCSHHKEKRQCTICSPESAFKRMSRRATTERKLDFSLSYEEFSVLVNGRCFYCDSEAPNGIDRIDNSIGYILSNCRSCCKICNIMKLDHNEKDFFRHIRKIISKQDFGE